MSITFMITIAYKGYAITLVNGSQHSVDLHYLSNLKNQLLYLALCTLSKGDAAVNEALLGRTLTLH